MLKPETNSLGWGRAAAMRFAKSEDEIKADIMKALEGKLSTEFQDYAQWQRVTAETETTLTSRPSTKTTSKPKSLSSAVSSSKYSSVTSNCSSLCLHPWNKKVLQVDPTAEIEKNKREVILSTQIAAQKRSIREYLKLRKMLRTSNETIRREIIEKEANSHNAVTDLLEKFEKYSAAAFVLAEQHEKSMASATRDFAETQAQINDELEKIEQDHSRVNEQLATSEGDLQVLRTYKDKVYPEKVLAITQLQNNIQTLFQEHKDLKTDLDRIIRGERNLLEMSHVKKAEKVVEKAAEVALEQSTIASLDNVAGSNISLMKEIKIQRDEITKLENEINVLTKEVNHLRSMTKTDVKKHVFPEIFPSMKKCSPDDDIILDIPVRRFIPI